MRGLSEAERALLDHVTRWGSAGYPIQKLGKAWTWGTDTVPGPPTVFRTRRSAVESFEAFYQVMRDAHAGRI